jgi:hypothetical protein
MKKFAILASLLPLANQNNLHAAKDLSEKLKDRDDVFQNVKLDELRQRF